MEAPSQRFLEKQLLECAKGGKGQHMVSAPLSRGS